MLLRERGDGENCSIGLYNRGDREMKKQRGGFTLLELMVVMAVIIILAAMLFPAWNAIARKGSKAAAEGVVAVVRGDKDAVGYWNFADEIVDTTLGYGTWKPNKEWSQHSGSINTTNSQYYATRSVGSGGTTTRWTGSSMPDLSVLGSSVEESTVGGSPDWVWWVYRKPTGAPAYRAENLARTTNMLGRMAVYGYSDTSTKKFIVGGFPSVKQYNTVNTPKVTVRAKPGRWSKEEGVFTAKLYPTTSPTRYYGFKIANIKKMKEMTLSFWVMPNGLTSGCLAAFGLDNMNTTTSPDVSPPVGTSIKVNSSGSVTLNWVSELLGGGTTGGTLNSSGNLIDKKWNHVVVVIRGSKSNSPINTQYIYVNGKQASGSGTYIKEPLWTDPVLYKKRLSLYFSRCIPTASGFKGWIAEAFLLKRAWTKEEVEDYYNKTKAYDDK